MDSIARTLLAAILTALALIHLYWAAAGARGASAAIPSTPGPQGRPLFQPGPAATIAIALLLFAAAAIATGYLLPAFQAVLLRTMAAVFALRAIGEFRYAGFFKHVKGTPFAYWDTRLFSPLCVVMALLALAGSGAFPL